MALAAEIGQLEQPYPVAGPLQRQAQISRDERRPIGRQAAVGRVERVLKPPASLKLLGGAQTPPRLPARLAVERRQLIAQLREPPVDSPDGDRYACVGRRRFGGGTNRRQRVFVAADPQPGREVSPRAAEARPGRIAKSVQVGPVSSAAVVDQDALGAEHADGILAVDKCSPIGEARARLGGRKLPLGFRPGAGKAGKRFVGVVQLEEVPFIPGERLLLPLADGHVDQRRIVEIEPLVDGVGPRVGLAGAPHESARHAHDRAQRAGGDRLDLRIGIVGQPERPLLAVIGPVVPPQRFEHLARLGKCDLRRQTALFSRGVSDLVKRCRHDGCPFRFLSRFCAEDEPDAAAGAGREAEDDRSRNPLVGVEIGVGHELHRNRPAVRIDGRDPRRGTGGDATPPRGRGQVQGGHDQAVGRGALDLENDLVGLGGSGKHQRQHQQKAGTQPAWHG